MLKTLSIRTGLLSLLAVMTLLLLIVSGIGIYALTQSSASLQRINHLQGEQMVQLNAWLYADPARVTKRGRPSA